MVTGVLDALYEFHSGYTLEVLDGSYEERAKKALRLYRKNCKNDEERQRYREQDFLDVCYSLERKLEGINPSTEEFWGYFEQERIEQEKVRAADLEFNRKIDEALAAMNIKK